MKKIYNQRMAADIDGDFVVFLIGIRINKIWKIHKWLPAVMAMPKMIKELYANPECGLLGHVFSSKVIVQYWRSFEHLEKYARDSDKSHLPAWQAFNKRMAKSRADIGIWHETYLVKAGQYEAIYSGMPSFGLASASKLVELNSKTNSARGRLEGDETSSS